MTEEVIPQKFFQVNQICIFFKKMKKLKIIQMKGAFIDESFL